MCDTCQTRVGSFALKKSQEVRLEIYARSYRFKVQRREDAACASGIHLKNSREGRLEIYATSYNFKDVRKRHAQAASTLYTRPPRSNYSPGAGKMQRACAAMPNSRHQSL